MSYDSFRPQLEKHNFKFSWVHRPSPAGHGFVTISLYLPETKKNIRHVFEVDLDILKRSILLRLFTNLMWRNGVLMMIKRASEEDNVGAKLFYGFAAHSAQHTRTLAAVSWIWKLLFAASLRLHVYNGKVAFRRPDAGVRMRPMNHAIPLNPINM